MTPANSSPDTPRSQPQPPGSDSATLESTFLKTVFAELTGRRKPTRRPRMGSTDSQQAK